MEKRAHFLKLSVDQANVLLIVQIQFSSRNVERHLYSFSQSEKLRNFFKDKMCKAQKESQHKFKTKIFDI